MTGIEVLRVEVQEHAASPAKGGRPTVPVVADARQGAQSPVIACVAEARGGVPGERGSRARGAYLVETTVGGFVVPCAVFFTGNPIRVVREGTGQRLIEVGRPRKVRPRGLCGPVYCGLRAGLGGAPLGCFYWLPLLPFLVRAPGEILSKRTSAF